MNAVIFLVDTLFGLYLMVVLLRLWLQLAQADFYNPLSQFIVKATHPLVGPLRRIIPSLGRLDTATLFLAIVIAAAKIVVLSLISYGGVSNPLGIFVTSIYIVIGEALRLILYVLIIRAVLSWVSQGQNPIESLMQQLTEPLIAPIRRIIPAMGGLDLSPMVVIIALLFIMKLLGF